MILFTFFIALGLVVVAANHVAAAYKFKSLLKMSRPEVWQQLGKPDAISPWFPSELALFRQRNTALLRSSPELNHALTKYEFSWKYGIPAVIFLVFIHGVVDAF